MGKCLCDSEAQGPQSAKEPIAVEMGRRGHGKNVPNGARVAFTG